MSDIVIYIQDNWKELLSILTGAIATASAIAALTPTPKDDKLIAKIYKVIDFIAINFGKAKDKGDD